MSKAQRAATPHPSASSASFATGAPPRRGLSAAMPRPRPRGDTGGERARSTPPAEPIAAPASAAVVGALAIPRATRRRGPSATPRVIEQELADRAAEIERNLEADHQRWLVEEERQRTAAVARRHGLTAQPIDLLEQVRLTLNGLRTLHPSQHAQVVQRLLPPALISAYLPYATARDRFFLANYMSAEQLQACMTAEAAELLGPHLQNPNVLYLCLRADMGASLVPWCNAKLFEDFLAICPGGASMIAPYLEDTQVLQLLPARAQLLVPCLAPRHIELCLERGWASQIVRYLQPHSCAGIAGFKLKPLGRLLRHNPWLFCWLTIEQLAMLELAEVVAELSHIEFLTPFEQMPEQTFEVIAHLLSAEQLRALRRPRERVPTPLSVRAVVGAGRAPGREA